jgi:hypothetical protein
MRRHAPNSGSLGDGYWPLSSHSQFDDLLLDRSAISRFNGGQRAASHLDTRFQAETITGLSERRFFGRVEL